MLLDDTTRRDVEEAAELHALLDAVNRKSLSMAQRGLIVAFDLGARDLEDDRPPYQFIQVTVERE